MGRFVDVMFFGYDVAETMGCSLLLFDTELADDADATMFEVCDGLCMEDALKSAQLLHKVAPETGIQLYFYDDEHNKDVCITLYHGVTGEPSPGMSEYVDLVGGVL